MGNLWVFSTLDLLNLDVTGGVCIYCATTWPQCEYLNPGRLMWLFIHFTGRSRLTSATAEC